MSQPDDWDDETLSKLYRQMPELEPDPATDAKILAAARRAVGTGPYRRRAWYGGLATAAVVVLTVALTRHAPEPTAMPVARSIPAPVASELNNAPLYRMSPAAPADSAAANAALEQAAEARVAREEKRALRRVPANSDLEATYSAAPLSAAAPAPVQQVQSAPAAAATAKAQPAPTGGNAMDDMLANDSAAPAAKRESRLAYQAEPAPSPAHSTSASAAAAAAAAPAAAPVILSREQPAHRSASSDMLGEAPVPGPRLDAAGKPLDYRPMMANGDYQGAWYQIGSLDAAHSNDAWLRLDYDLLSRLSGHPATTLCAGSADVAPELRDACALLQAESGSRRQKALRKKLAQTLGKDAEHAYWWQAQKDLP